ncbi:MAG: serine hydrolase [Bacteroidetes bacterium]|nr:serine hydrolase [Bacteroidota bacterium]
MKFTTALALLLLWALPSIAQTDANLLEKLMQQKPDQFGKMLAHPNDYRLQIIYTQIDRDKNNIPHFKEYAYHLNPKEYFYPASTVKMPLAFLALEKINNLKVKGLTKSTLMVYDSVADRQETIYNNPYSINGTQNIEQAVKEIFLVSDNNAANRLFEFVTPHTVHEQLAAKGYKDVYIRNRLELGRSAKENRSTQAIDFYNEKGKVIYHQPAQFNKDSLPYYNAFIGNSYWNNQDSLIKGPLNFSEKNRIYLNDLTHILKSVLFFDQTPPAQRFNLTTEDRKFLLHWMHTLPTESQYPTYDTANYWPAYCKFLYTGSAKGPFPSNIKIFNKVGDAYGFLLDIAYVMDPEKKVEFMLSAVIYCNSDGILNDSKYDYDTVGFPFYKNLGQLIYNYELKRKKAFLPNLDPILAAAK